MKKLRHTKVILILTGKKIEEPLLVTWMKIIGMSGDANNPCHQFGSVKKKKKFNNFSATLNLI